VSETQLLESIEELVKAAASGPISTKYCAYEPLCQAEEVFGYIETAPTPSGSPWRHIQLTEKGRQALAEWKQGKER
jgi:hypothetical protein